MIDFIETLSRRSKWFILLATDIVIMCIAFYTAYALRFGTILPAEPLQATWPMLPALIFAGSVYAIALGLPKIIVHAFEIRAAKNIALCASLLILTAMSLSFFFDFGAPRSIPIIFGILFFIGSVASRLLAILLLDQIENIGKTLEPVAIYGAGSAGIQLASALRRSNEVKPIAFIDDNIFLRKRTVAGLSVHAPTSLHKLVRAKKIKRILIAIPSSSKRRQREILKQLEHLPCKVQILPSFVELIESKETFENLRLVSPEKLLGRDKLDVIVPNIETPYKGKSVLITGAGGSIGSELCKQILEYTPSKLVLFEQSELALYSIEKTLSPLAKEKGITLIPVLGSICDTADVQHVLGAYNIEVVLHAAAYKHVPLLEMNELAGLRNNVLGTHTMAKLSAKAGIQRFVLVSTDKAVRPTNMMGASKRLAELVIQDIERRCPDTVFSIVRFGNVLGSSGSVIPLFHEQIAKGGPVTLTHEDVTRFFMAVSEAARLVLIAGSLASEGDVFVLDMGKSVKIKDLALRMIELSGLSILSTENPNGDIEIVTTGLRPGEKLYEELLVGEETLSTPHPKILRAKEECLSELEVANLLKTLRKAIETNDNDAARALVKRWVDGYHIPKDAHNMQNYPAQ